MAGDHRNIPLTMGRWSVVDERDYARVSGYCWHASVRSDGPAYARTYGRGPGCGKAHQVVYMHRLILDAPPGSIVDHINGDGLDNRRANLRLCNTDGHARNRGPSAGKSSQYKGVSYYQAGKKWESCITVGRRKRHLGYYRSEVTAALAYDWAARFYFHNFARPNFTAQAAAVDAVLKEQE